MNRRERLEQMGDKMKKFNNVYIKNFPEDIDDERLKEMFEVYGKIISAKVCTYFLEFKITSVLHHSFLAHLSLSSRWAIVIALHMCTSSVVCRAMSTIYLR